MWKRILLLLISLTLVISLAKIVYGSATAPPLGTHFPQKITRPSVYFDITIKGELALDNGCLRVSGVGEHSFLLIWDPRFSTRTEQGIVQVIDSSTGEVLASAGDYVATGGGPPTEMGLKEPIPDECPGPYWLVGHTIKKIDKP